MIKYLPMYIDATFEITTPAFLGGPDGATINDGLRPPTLKGLMRFWWRTLFGHITDISDLARREVVVFGDIDFGQGLRIIPIKCTTNELVPSGTREPSSLSYIGFGPIMYSSIYNRSAIAPEKEIFCFRLALKSERHAKDIAQTLWLLDMAGGCGSRSRRGWGSFHVVTVPEKPPEIKDEFPAFSCECENVFDLIKSWKIFLESYKGRTTLPLFTAFSSFTKVFVWGRIFNTSELAHKEMADTFKTYRTSLGGRGGVGKPDHDTAYAFIGEYSKIASTSPKTVSDVPKRTAFGLPHNYTLKNSFNKRISLQVIPANCESDRRASPLFFHVTKLKGENKYVPVLVYLNSLFLPDLPPGSSHPTKKIRMKVSEKIQDFPPLSITANAVHDFLCELAKDKNIKGKLLIP